MSTLPHRGGRVSPAAPGSAARAWIRLGAAVSVTLVLCLAPALAAILTLGSRRAVRRVGARSLHLLSRVLCPLLGIRVSREGAVPPAPVLLCPNHVTYVDILVLASVTDLVFVSRADLAGWPGIGPVSRLGGTIYLDRDRKRDTARAGGEVGDALDRGFRVVVFPEGGAGDGLSVRPFRPSLLEPACRRGVPCAAVTLRYAVPGGSADDVANLVAWADDTPFTTHAMRFLRIPRTDVLVTIHAARRGSERKALAAELETDCASALGGGASAAGGPAAPATSAGAPSPGR